MSSWLILLGVVGAGLMSVSLLVLACMLFAQGRVGMALLALGGMSVIIGSAILGDMYVTGWWDR